MKQCTDEHLNFTR